MSVCVCSYGYFVQNDSYFLCYEPAVIAKVFAEMRKNYFQEIAGHKVPICVCLSVCNVNGDRCFIDLDVPGSVFPANDVR